LNSGGRFLQLLMVWSSGDCSLGGLARQLGFRVFAACLAFLPPWFASPPSIVYTDYYQTWGGMLNDLTARATGQFFFPYAGGGTGTHKQLTRHRRVTSQAEDAQVGYLFPDLGTGARSQ